MKKSEFAQKLLEAPATEADVKILVDGEVYEIEEVTCETFDNKTTIYLRGI